MRDFRFHVATITGIFLALGVGLFIGYFTANSQQFYPLKNQVAAVQKHNHAVEEENHSLKQQQDVLSNRLIHLHTEVDQLANLSLVKRLSGQQVSLISVGAGPSIPLTDQIWNALLMAGARRLGEIHIHGSLLPPRPQGLQEILDRIHAGPDDDPESAIAQALGVDIATGGDPLLPLALNHRGVAIDVAGSFNARPDLIILLNNVDTPDSLRKMTRSSSPATLLTRALQDQEVRIVMCETAGDPYSAASYFSNLGVSVVDDVDTVEGKVALVWASQGSSGHFGTRPDADSLLPEAPRP